MARLLNSQIELRKRQIGQEPIANVDEGFRRNFEIGITTGIGSIVPFIRQMVEKSKEEYVALLQKDRGEVDG